MRRLTAITSSAVSLSPHWALLFTLAAALEASAAAPEPLTPERAGQVVGEELKFLSTQPGVAGASIVVLEPATGRILAAKAHGRRSLTANVPTGSTLKTLLVAAALEAGLDPAQRFEGEQGQWRVDGGTLRDHRAHDWLDAERVLVRSSNVGAAKIAQKVGPTRLLELLEAMAFRDALPGGWAASPLAEASKWGGAKALQWSAGIGTEASPLHLAAAYGAVVNGGVWVAPTMAGNGERKQVLSAKTSEQLVRMLEHAVSGPQAVGGGAAVAGLRVGGKTGTTGPLPGAKTHLAHFIGFAPVGAPSVVIAISVEVKGRGYHGGTVAAPSFARVVRGLLAGEQ